MLWFEFVGRLDKEECRLGARKEWMRSGWMVVVAEKIRWFRPMITHGDGGGGKRAIYV